MTEEEGEWGRLEETVIVNGKTDSTVTRTHELVKDDIMIGRKNGCDIHFSRQEISRLHMELHRVREKGSARPDSYYVVDTSRNGIWVNGVRVSEKNARHEIFSGDLISLVNPLQGAVLRVELKFISFRKDDQGASDNEDDVDDSATCTLQCDPFEDEKDGADERGRKFEDVYTLCGELGSGSFGDVWKAQNRATGEYVAVKKISIAKITKARPKLGLEGAIKFIKNEFSIMSELDHSNIIKVIDIFDNDKKYIHIVLEMACGGDLQDYIEYGDKLEEDKIRSLFLQIVRAVEYLHSKHVIHRDLKPQNFLVMDKEATTVKITDFGTSKITSSTTIAKTLVGTQLYLAPEMVSFFMGEGPRCYTSAVDIWALGCILYFMLSKISPFDVKERMFACIMEAKYSFDDPVWTRVSEAAKDLISKLLVKDPNERLTAKEILSHPWCMGKSALSEEERHAFDYKKGKTFIGDFGMTRSGGQTYGALDEIMSEDSIEPAKDLEPPPAKKADTRPECKYGTKCYRTKNPEHTKKFKHSFLEV